MKPTGTFALKPQLPNIPQELVFEEILPRLPLRSLSRFRSISKPWCATISDPKFALKKPLRIAALGDSSILYDIDCQSCNIEQRNLPPVLNDYHDGDVRLLFSYNGLLLLEFDNDVFMFNPSTRKYKKCKARDFADNCVDIGGICYDFSTRNYKVVVKMIPCSMTPGFDAEWMELCSFDAKSNRCKRFEYPPGFAGLRSCGPVIDQKMYWLVCEKEKVLSHDEDDESWEFYGQEDEDREEEDDGSWKFHAEEDEDREIVPDGGCRRVKYEGIEIFYFDAVKDIFVAVPSPDPKNGSKNDIRCLFDLDGCLAMVRLEKAGGSFEDMVMEVLVMKCYGGKESWTPWFTFSNFNGKNPYCFKPLSITIGGELVISLVNNIYKPRDKVVAYNRKADTYRDIFVPEGGCEAAIVYRESVLCLPDPTSSEYDDAFDEYDDGSDYDYGSSWY